MALGGRQELLPVVPYLLREESSAIFCPRPGTLSFSGLLPLDLIIILLAIEGIEESFNCRTVMSLRSRQVWTCPRLRF